MPISSENKMIATSALKAFGGKPSVSRYWDHYSRSNIDILSVSNRLYKGVTSYSTIGLSSYSIGYTIGEKPLRVEFVGASTDEFYPNILATCAFEVINFKPFNLSWSNHERHCR